MSRPAEPQANAATPEVANIGAGHGDGLSQMTGQTIMIAVPTINITPLEEVLPCVAHPDGSCRGARRTCWAT
jgi:chemotaxis protein CheY-P-specific phosphatase CheC